jgi:hypothetical protein
MAEDEAAGSARERLPSERSSPAVEDGAGGKDAVTPRLSAHERQLVSARARQRVEQLDAARAAANQSDAPSEQPLQRKQEPDSEPPPGEPPQATDGVASATAALVESSATGAACGTGDPGELPVVLEGPLGHRRHLVLGAHDGLAAVLAETDSVGVPPHDAAVFLQQPLAQTAVQLAFIGRASAQLLVVGASSLRSAAGVEPGATLYVRSRVDTASLSGVDEELMAEPEAEPPVRSRECRICAMGDDDGECAPDDRLIAPCVCTCSADYLRCV